MNRLDELKIKKENLLMRNTLNVICVKLCETMTNMNIDDVVYDELDKIVDIIVNAKGKLHEI